MTLEEGKRRALELLDEYGGSVDSETEMRLADFFDMAQKRMAQIKKLPRVWTVERQEGVTEYAMPADFLSLRCIRRNGRQATMRYRWKGGKLVIPAEDAGQIELEYFALPAAITGQTPGSYVFEVAEDAAACMPFLVAAQLLAGDLVQDNGALLELFNLMVSSLDTALPGSGGMRNTFYQG